MLANAKTKVCGIIGNPVAHSMSPVMHNTAFKKLGLNYVYLAFPVTQVQDALTGMKALGMRGFSVTIPHKVEVMPYLDEVDPIAQKIGAVNTIVNDQGYLKGYNSDWQGLVRSLEAYSTIKGKKVVMLGAGGSARAIAYGIKHKKGELTILNRTPEKARDLGKDVGGHWGLLSQHETISKADIIINTSSVGMYPEVDKSIIEAKHLRPGQIVNDIIYNPLETKLLQQAKERGCTVIPGSEMLVLQGAAQFELWTGEEAPVDVMRQAVLKHLNIGKQNGS